VAEICDQVSWIEKGVLRESGEAAKVVQAYRANASY
jgi:ABC-type polysaccharide/polyol phosphate transport system ATPase subunit